MSEKIVFVGLMTAPETFAIPADEQVVVFAGDVADAATGITAESVEELIELIEGSGGYRVAREAAGATRVGRRVMVKDDVSDVWWECRRAWEVSILRIDADRVKIGVEIDEMLAPAVIDPDGGYDRDPASAIWPTDEEIEAVLAEKLGRPQRLLADDDMGDSLIEAIRWCVAR